ncbi:MAG: DUF488 domain-containing protein [Novosphingobium sp.]|nr:DUF488 domain-containing protein [Novosphingobium sp.]
MKGTIGLKRIYQTREAGDGQRVLVDRIWPRGISKQAAALDFWLKDIAPGTALRKWFGHDPARFGEFRERYRRELDANSDAVAELCDLADRGDVTLLYAAYDERHNQAVVLAEYLSERGYRLRNPV